MPAEAEPGGVAGAGDELRVHGLTKAYPSPRGPIAVLRDVALACRPGELVAVTGASGSGKSTLLHVLGGMLHPDAGDVRLAGVDPWALGPSRRAAWRNSQVGFVFQFHHLLAELTAWENVLAPAWIAGREGAEERSRARGLLERLGLTERLQAHPSELSGGEAQRVAICRALLLTPRLVLADEPTGNLDRDAGRRVLDELLDLQRERRFILLVATHDERLAGDCDRILRLEGGRLTSVALE